MKNNCWIWLRAHNASDPIANIDGKNFSVKRILFKKKYPLKSLDGYLKDSCGNRKCINPSHLINREDFFNSLIYKNPKNGCWEWQGMKKSGYGYFSINRKDLAVHRIMYEKHKGKIPKGINVCHFCDNPLCCNPDHLWIGSQSDNIKDMISKKRDYKSFGINHHKCKITEEDVYIIRQKYKEGMKMKSIHRLLNIPYRTIQHICTNNTWKHLL